MGHGSCALGYHWSHIITSYGSYALGYSCLECHVMTNRSIRNRKKPETEETETAKKPKPEKPLFTIRFRYLLLDIRG